MSDDSVGCPFCGGSGFTRKADDTKQCICAFARNVRKRLGDDIALSQPVIYNSPLFAPPLEGGGTPSVDLSGEDLFIKAWWQEFKPHFRLVAQHLLERHSFGWFYHIVSDERIKSVFVGSESYVARPRKKREDVVTFNGLSDLVGSEFDLVIIRLGFVCHKNVALAGAFKEALRIRELLNKPTWILEEPDSPFEPGHFAYSEDVAAYINSRYTTIDLRSGPPDLADTPKRGVEGAPLPVEDGLSLDEQETKRPSRRPVVDITGLVNDSVLGMGNKRKKSKKQWGGDA